jgi:hypothetical protein
LKEQPVIGKKIRVNGRYGLQLRSYLEGRKIGNVSLAPTLHVNCFGFAYSTIICLERDSINDLHFADNVKGLCLIN